MKVLILTSTFPRWHGDKEPPFVYDLSLRISKRYHCTILAPHHKGSKTKETMSNMEIRRFRYLPTSMQTLAYDGGIISKLKQNKLRYLQIPFFLFFEFLSTVNLLRKTNFQVIHAHWVIPQGLIVALARIVTRKKTPILCTLHGGDLYTLNNFILNKLKIFILNQVDSITVVSKVMKHDLIELGIDEAKIHVIPMGVDFKNTFKPIPNIKKNTHSVLFVGRLVEKKGVKFLIQAMQKVIMTLPDAELYIAGTGTEHDNLVNLANKFGIQQNIHFLGSIHNTGLPLLYNQHPVVAFPSVIAKSGDMEGFGLVLSEALGCECGVVASNLPAVRDIVKHDFNALIVEPEDIDALSNAIIKLLQDKTLAIKLGQNGRDFVLKNFDWETISNQYIKLISYIQT